MAVEMNQVSVVVAAMGYKMGAVYRPGRQKANKRLVLSKDFRGC